MSAPCGERSSLAREHERARARVARHLGDPRREALERGGVERIERLRAIEHEQRHRVAALQLHRVHRTGR
jgi:hypothetical protein